MTEREKKSFLRSTKIVSDNIVECLTIMGLPNSQKNHRTVLAAFEALAIEHYAEMKNGDTIKS